MKNKQHKFLSFFLVASTLILMSNSGGSPGGKSGSRGDNKVSCATNGGCHGPKAPTYQTMISSTIPSVGYIPGNEYTITISAIESTKSKFGFELVAEDTNTVSQGSFVSNADVAISGKRATHKFQSTDGTGAKTWNVVWKAPSTGSGKLTFYAAVLAANDNGMTSGDEVLLDSFSVKENTSVSVVNILENDFNVYPNPVKDILCITGNIPKYANAIILDGAGKQVYSAKYEQKLNVEFLPAGGYTLCLEVENMIFRKKFLKID